MHPVPGQELGFSDGRRCGEDGPGGGDFGGVCGGGGEDGAGELGGGGADGVAGDEFAGGEGERAGDLAGVGGGEIGAGAVVLQDFVGLAPDGAAFGADSGGFCGEDGDVVGGAAGEGNRWNDKFASWRPRQVQNLVIASPCVAIHGRAVHEWVRSAWIATAQAGLAMTELKHRSKEEASSDYPATQAARNIWLPAGSLPEAGTGVRMGRAWIASQGIAMTAE